MDTYALKKFSDADVAKFDWGWLEWYIGAPYKNSDEMTFGKCTIYPDHGNPRHYHPNCEEILHVASGAIDHYIEGEGWFPMDEGDSITIPANIWHCARNRGESNAVLFISFSSADRQTVGE